jgi:hypothetical protein
MENPSSQWPRKRGEGHGEQLGSGSQRWKATVRLEAVIATATMDEATRSAWCREQGLYPAEHPRSDAKLHQH